MSYDANQKEAPLVRCAACGRPSYVTRWPGGVYTCRDCRRAQ